nr:MAG TPA: hypothetical protein [Caudoviricetes sp.]
MLSLCLPIVVLLTSLLFNFFILHYLRTAIFKIPLNNINRQSSDCLY